MHSQRYEWVDALKFLGIFAIYIGHLGNVSGRFYEFVFLYHVQIFFFSAGFFASYNKKIGIAKFISDKFKRLMIPYFAFSFITVIVKTLNTRMDFDQFLDAILSVLYGVRNGGFVGGMWFINCLFVICIMDYLSFRILKNKYAVLALALIAFFCSQYLLPKNPLGEPSWFMNIDSALAYWWLMPAGRIMFPYISKISQERNEIIFYLLLLALLSLAAFAFLDKKHFLFSFMTTFAHAIPLTKWFWTINYIIEPLFLVLANVFASIILSKSAFICSLGRNSLNLCGIETALKICIPLALASLGIKFAIFGEVQAFLYTAACLFLGNRLTRWLTFNFGGPFNIR